MKGKKSITAILILFLLIIVGGAAYFFYRNGNTFSSDFQLIKEYGKITVKRPNDSDFVQINEPAVSLPSGTEIKTNGQSHVKFFDNSLITLSNNSDVVVSIDKSKQTIKQKTGNIWVRLNKGLTSRDFMVNVLDIGVKANNGVYFSSEIDPSQSGKATIYPLNEQISAQKVLVEKNQTSKEDPKSVSKGQALTVSANLDTDALTVGNLDPNFKTSYWYRKNSLIDTQFGKDPTNITFEWLKNNSELGDMNLKETTSSQLAIIDRSYKFASSPSDVCTSLKVSSTDDTMSGLESQKDILGANYDLFVQYYTSVKTACVDGTASPEEINSANVIYDSLRKSLDQQINQDFEKEMSQAITKYTHIEGEGASTCLMYEGVVADDALNSLNSIEKKYSQKEVAANQYRDSINKIKNACADKLINADERAAIEASMPK